MAVYYGDGAARDLAINLSDRLEQRFDGELEFQHTWWSFRYLGHPELAREAAMAAVSADMIIISLGHAAELPAEVRNLVETSLPLRVLTVGAFIVIHHYAAAAVSAFSQEPYLRGLAQRANLDYLPLFSPTEQPETVDRLREDQDSPFIFEENRAESADHATRWGLNE